MVAELEKVGLGICFLAEARRSDAPALVGFNAARTARMALGSGVIQPGAGTPTDIAQTATTLSHKEREGQAAVKSHYQQLLFEQTGNVARITFNRPRAFNAVDVALAAEFRNAVSRVEEDDEIRALVFTGAGKAFCSGGDVNGFAAAGTEVPSVISEMLDAWHAGLEALDRLPIPTIAAVNGAAAGIGFSLACACDLRFAAESAKFTLAYTRIGLSPDGSSTYHLPRLLGQARALDLALTNRVLDAAEAASWGLVSRVYPDWAFQSEVDAVAARLAEGPTRALGATKHLMKSGWTAALRDQLDREGESISRLSATRDGQEGIAAFVDKRTARFVGGPARDREPRTSD